MCGKSGVTLRRGVSVPKGEREDYAHHSLLSPILISDQSPGTLPLITALAADVGTLPGGWWVYTGCTWEGVVYQGVYQGVYTRVYLPGYPTRVYLPEYPTRGTSQVCIPQGVPHRCIYHRVYHTGYTPGCTIPGIPPGCTTSQVCTRVYLSGVHKGVPRVCTGLYLGVYRAIP